MVNQNNDMNILIDAHMLGSNQGGNERYIRNLIESFDKKIKKNIYILSSEKLPNVKNIAYQNIILRLLIKNNLLRILILLPFLIHKYKIDIIHSTYVGPLFLGKSKLVLTVHDLSFKKYPNLFSIRERVIFSTLFKYSLIKSSAIISPSFFTKKELVKYFPKVNNKIFVTYEGLTKIFKPTNLAFSRKYLRKKFKIDRPFILAFNQYPKKKNIKNTISSFKEILNQRKNVLLVIVGKKYLFNFNTKNILYLGRVSDQDLNHLYNLSITLVFPSFYEGFSLPVLESLNVGKIPIVSNIPIHKEIFGNKVIYVNPYSVKDITKKILFFLDHQNHHLLKESNKMDISNKFSWGKTSFFTAKVYQQIISDSYNFKKKI